MSETNNNQDISSFFQKQQQKKQTQKKQQNKQQEKQASEQKKQEEQKNVANVNKEFESSDEEDNQGQIDIGVGKVKDIKEVKKQQKMAQDAKREHDFKWETMGGIDRTKSQHQQQQQNKEQAKTAGKTTGDIKFSGRPQFQKSKNVGNKMDFPELGDNAPMKIGQTQSAPAQVQQQQQPVKEAVKPTFIKQTKTQPKDSQQEEIKPAIFVPLDPKNVKTQPQPQPKEQVQAAESEQTQEEKKERPKFTGTFKNLLKSQQEENAEANKNLPELQEKLKQEIKIHEPRQPRKTGEQGAQNQRNQEQDNEFDEVVTEEKKREHGNKRGGFRGGQRGGRGGFDRNGEGEHHDTEHHRGERPHKEHKEKKPFNKDKQPKQHEEHKNQPAVKQPAIVVNKNVQDTAFDGWGSANQLF